MIPLMTLHLTPSQIDKLVSLPETGMGYQRVDLVLRDGRVLRDIMVFNAEEAQVDDGQLTGNDVVDVVLSSPH
jgi:hypothetical protein